MTANGSVVCWGSEEHGQSGQGQQSSVDCNDEKKTLDSIPQSEDAKIACGASFTVCVNNGMYP